MKPKKLKEVIDFIDDAMLRNKTKYEKHGSDNDIVVNYTLEMDKVESAILVRFNEGEDNIYIWVHSEFSELFDKEITIKDLSSGSVLIEELLSDLYIEVSRQNDIVNEITKKLKEVLELQSRLGVKDLIKIKGIRE